MKTTTLAMVAVLATTTLAQAGVIFSDDFNRPDSTSVGNGWLESENVPTDAAIAGNRLYFADNAANIIHQLSLISNPFYDIDVALDVLSGSVLVELSTDNVTFTRLDVLGVGVGQHLFTTWLAGSTMRG